MIVADSAECISAIYPITPSSAAALRGHSRKLSSARAALPETEVTDLRTPDLSDTEDDDLATNANQNSSHLHHNKTRVSGSRPSGHGHHGPRGTRVM